MAAQGDHACAVIPASGDAMQLPRRRFLHLTACAIAAATQPPAARAQSYPSRPVRIVVTFPPGGANDIHARLMGQWLSERLGQPFVVENRPGASGNIGTEAVVRSPPDGYTLVFLSTAHAVNAVTYEKLNYDLLTRYRRSFGFRRTRMLMTQSLVIPGRRNPGTNPCSAAVVMDSGFASP